MSHSAVLITNTEDASVDTQLERFNEQGDEADFFMTKEVIVPKGAYPKALIDIAEEYEHWHTMAIDDKKFGYTGEYMEKAKASRAMDAVANPEEAKEMVRSWHGGELDEAGNLFTLNNPDAKWDWYSVGGRWSGFFIAKEDSDSELVMEPHYSETQKEVDGWLKQRRTDVIKVKDIDWDAMKKKAGDEPLYTFAVLHNDVWYERGEMGWWGVVSDGKPVDEWEAEWRKLIDSLDPESEVTVVDVHI